MGIRELLKLLREKAMAPHSSTLAWKIPWTEEPGRLQSMGSLRVGDTTERLHFHFSLSCIGEGNDNPLQCSCLENPRDGGAWWAAVYGVTQSQTRSSSSSSFWKENWKANSNLQIGQHQVYFIKKSINGLAWNKYPFLCVCMCLGQGDEIGKEPPKTSITYSNKTRTLRHSHK